MSGEQSASATPGRMPAIGRIGWMPGALGALVGIALTGLISFHFARIDPALPWLIAPMGASAVLVFVLPASPLSQPWPVLGGHLVAAAIGLLAHWAVPLPWLAGGVAVGGAIAAMSVTRSLHPPAGGTALLTALASPGLAQAGWHFLLAPVTLNVLALLACGYVWNRATGHSWPHRPAPMPALPDWAGHIEDQDLDSVLAEWNDVLDISRDDLLALIHAVEARVRQRRNVR